MHLDVGEVAFTSHIHLPAMSVSNHMYRPMISPVARDMQRLSHLKSLPSLGRVIASAA